MTGPSVATTAAFTSEGTLAMVGSAQGTSGWDGPPVTTNQIVPSGGYTGTSLSQLAKQNQASMQASISAPVLNSAGHFQLNAGRMMQAGIDEFGAMICRALAGIDILGLHPFGFMNAWADGLDAQAQQALGTAQTAQATANTAVNAVNTQQQQQSAGGASVSVSPFPPGYSGSLGPGWTVGGSAGSAPWQTGQYGASLAQQPSGHVVQGIQYGLNTTVMKTDSHTMSGVCGYGDPNSFAMTSLIVRAAADMSSFIYANVFIHHVYLGYGSFNPSTGAWTFNDWANASFLLTAGDTLSLAVVGQTATFSQNGRPILSHSDVTGQVPVGSSNRNVGLLSQQAADSWGNVSVGWTMASFTAADTASPPTLGTGWSIYRSSSSTISLGNGSSYGWFMLPSGSPGTFDTVRQSAGITWYDFPAGKVLIPKTGWWAVSLGVNFSLAPIGAAAGFSVVPNGSSTDTVARLGHFYDTTNAGTAAPNGFVTLGAATAVIYLNAGDRVTPGVRTSSDTTYNLQITGVGAGYATYFDGVFLGNN